MYKKSQTEVADIEIFPGNLFCVSFRKGSEVDLEAARRIIDATNQLIDDEIPIRGGVYDLSNLVYVSEEARIYSTDTNNLKGTVVAVGLISNSFLGNLVGNLYLTLTRKAQFPIRMFQSPISAEHWVRKTMRDYMEKHHPEKLNKAA
ncbi:hypothetical protein ACFLR1_07330 [Bacteroidota bacterium]